MAAQTTAHPPREDFNDDGDAPAKSAVTRALDLIARGKIAMLAVNRCDVGGKARFRALVGSEVAVLRRVLSDPSSPSSKRSLQCSNIPHLEAIAATVIRAQGATDIYRPFSPSPSTLTSENPGKPKLRVDVVADGGMTWVKVISKNAQGLRAEMGVGVDGLEDGDESDSDVDGDEVSAGVTPGDLVSSELSSRLIHLAKSYLSTAASHPTNYRPPTVVFAFVREEGPGAIVPESDMGLKLRRELEGLDVVVTFGTYARNLFTGGAESASRVAESSTLNSIKAATALLDASTCVSLVSDVSFLFLHYRTTGFNSATSPDRNPSWDPATYERYISRVDTLRPTHPLRMQVEEEVSKFERCVRGGGGAKRPLLEELRVVLAPDSRPDSGAPRLVISVFAARKLVQIVNARANSWERARARGLFVPWGELVVKYGSWDVASGEIKASVREFRKGTTGKRPENGQVELDWMDVLALLTKDEDLGDHETAAEGMPAMCPHFLLPVLFDTVTPPSTNHPCISAVVPSVLATDTASDETKGDFALAHRNAWAIVTANRRDGLKWRERGAEVYIHGARSLFRSVGGGDTSAAG